MQSIAVHLSEVHRLGDMDLWGLLQGRMDCGAV